MRDARSLAAMLAEDTKEERHLPRETHEEMGAEMDYDSEEGELDELADEGHMVAAEEIMQAFQDRDVTALMEALRSFVRMNQ
jgi:hypothetical protein